jgi:hypothetical protein
VPRSREGQARRAGKEGRQGEGREGQARRAGKEGRQGGQAKRAGKEGWELVANEGTVY